MEIRFHSGITVLKGKFQENLVVWKSMSSISAVPLIRFVSGELSSMEILKELSESENTFS